MRFPRSLATLAATALVAAVTAGPALSQERVTVGGGPLGGTFYVVVSGFAKILNEDVEGIDASIEVNAGSSHNVQLVDAGTTDFGITNASVLKAGLDGEGWADGEIHDNVRLLMGTQLSYIHFWTLAGSGITELDDLNGRIVNLSKKGSGADITGRKIIETLGLEPAKITNLGHTEANQAMQDGLVDAALTAGGVPHPAVASLSSTTDTVIFGVTGDQAAAFRKVAPALVEAEIPANVYEGQTEPVPTLGDWNVIIVHKDMSEDLVYRVMRATFDNIDKWIAVHRSAEETKPENITDLMDYPLHPGAERFYKEAGLL